MYRFCSNCREMNDWDRKTCDRCGASLRRPEGESYVEKLIWALHHPEKGTVLRAAKILGDLKAREAADTLAQVLGDPHTDPYVGAAAARSLGVIGDEGYRTALIEALESGPVSVRLAAVEALGSLGPDQAAVDALHRASRRDRSERVSGSAGKVLGRWSK